MKVYSDHFKSTDFYPKGKKAAERVFLEAVVLGKVENVENSIKKGVNVNVTDEDWNTALHITAAKGDVATATALLADKNINVNAKTALGDTPLITAVTFNRLDFTKLLLRNGANPNIRNNIERTALHLAKSFGIVNELLFYKAYINVVDAFGSTPLSLCIIEHPSKIIARTLLKKGADPNLRTMKPLPLLLELCLNCRNEDQLEFVDLLINYKADLHIRSKSANQTALHIASITGYTPLAKMLVSMGANLKAKDVLDRTPIDVAIQHEHRDLIAYYKQLKIEKYQKKPQGPVMAETISGASMGSFKKQRKFVKFTEIKSTESDEEVYLQHL